VEELRLVAGARGGPGYTLMDGDEPVAFLTRRNGRSPIELETGDQILRFRLVGVFRRRVRIEDQTGQPWATITEPEFGETRFELPGELPYTLQGDVTKYVVRDTIGRELLHVIRGGGGARLLVSLREAPQLVVLAAVLGYVTIAEVNAGSGPSGPN
jgi:hypothetical protein